VTQYTTKITPEALESMKQSQLELVTLQLTPTEARMLATAASARGMHYSEKGHGERPGWGKQAREYAALAAKVDRQRRL